MQKLYHQHMIVPGFRGCSTQERGPAKFVGLASCGSCFFVEIGSSVHP